MDSSIKHAISHDEINNAFLNNEFALYYQPQFNLLSSSFEGVEALVRWVRPNGMLLPGDFLYAVEKAGLIVRLGEWVLNEACQQNKDWQTKGLLPIRMAVNIYGEQFYQPNFVDAIFAVLDKYKLEARFLELELHENIIIHTGDHAVYDNIVRLRSRGITIALDDFGTGFSSIGHLKRIRVDRIKIDQSYIKHIHTNAEDAAIVKAIIALAAGLNLKSLAEGVESHQQLQVLLKYDCQEAQGFYFSEPLTAQETEDFLQLYDNNPFRFKHL
jgi:EAL domain-containing protein (putative c-di-GMP-specific phosphodiesterase class I)